MDVGSTSLQQYKEIGANKQGTWLVKQSESVKCSLLLVTLGSNLYPPWTSVTGLEVEDKTIILDGVF